MELSLMSDTDRSLLLFLETCAVDDAGKIDSSKMNCEDFDLARRWNNGGFIQFGRIAYHDSNRTQKTHWVILSDDAWERAHTERQSRANRARVQHPYEMVKLDEGHR